MRVFAEWFVVQDGRIVLVPGEDERMLVCIWRCWLIILVIGFVRDSGGVPTPNWDRNGLLTWVLPSRPPGNFTPFGCPPAGIKWRRLRPAARP